MPNEPYHPEGKGDLSSGFGGQTQWESLTGDQNNEFILSVPQCSDTHIGMQPQTRHKRDSHSPRTSFAHPSENTLATNDNGIDALKKVVVYPLKPQNDDEDDWRSCLDRVGEVYGNYLWESELLSSESR